MAEPGRTHRWLRDKRVLVVAALLFLALLLAAVGVSVAAFTASSESHGSISAGDLTFDLAPASAIVDTSGMKPGDSRAGVVTLTNRQAAGSFSLGFGGIGSSTLASTLRLTVKRTAPAAQTLYDGSLAGVPTLPLGTVGTGQAVTLALTFAWPADAVDPSLQAQSIPLVLDWSART